MAACFGRTGHGSQNPILPHYVTTSFPNRLEVLPGTCKRKEFALAMPLATDLRKPNNEELVRIIGNLAWQRVTGIQLAVN